MRRLPCLRRATGDGAMMQCRAESVLHKTRRAKLFTMFAAGSVFCGTSAQYTPVRHLVHIARHVGGSAWCEVT